MSSNRRDRASEIYSATVMGREVVLVKGEIESRMDQWWCGSCSALDLVCDDGDVNGD